MRTAAKLTQLACSRQSCHCSIRTATCQARPAATAARTPRWTPGRRSCTNTLFICTQDDRWPGALARRVPGSGPVAGGVGLDGGAHVLSEARGAPLVVGG